MSMIKFILMIGIIGALCWLGTKIFVILVPFLIGFLLAKTSNIIASPIAGLFTKSDPSKIRPGQKKSTRTKVAELCICHSDNPAADNRCFYLYSSYRSGE